MFGAAKMRTMGGGALSAVAEVVELQLLGRCDRCIDLCVGVPRGGGSLHRVSFHESSFLGTEPDQTVVWQPRRAPDTTPTELRTERYSTVYTNALPIPFAYL